MKNDLHRTKLEPELFIFTRLALSIYIPKQKFFQVEFFWQVHDKIVAEKIDLQYSLLGN